MKKKARRRKKRQAPARGIGAGEDLQWIFPSNALGEESGFHDAGVETFKGNFYRYLAREAIQNSLDAKAPSIGQPVLVKFQVLELSPDDLPDFSSLREVYRRCRAYWSTDSKACAFFDSAYEIAGRSSIRALRVSDFSTTGVLGDNEDRGKNWYSLIRCSGSSSKYGGEGGSYGIGKNAPFAASNLRTVLYSTKTIDSGQAFVGVARLVTHKDSDGIKVHPVGYLGGPDGQAVRDPRAIPSHFRRSKEGSDVIILGFKAEDNWEDELRLSVLENFWPAILFDELIVQIGDQTISKGNLGELLESSSGEEDFTAHEYYQSYQSATLEFKEELPNLGKVQLYLRAGQTELPKRIAMVRTPGMVVFRKKALGPIPFCGLFLCRNRAGNKLLRDMEPPRHDFWDPDFPEKGMSKRYEREYTAFIRECVKQLTGTDDTSVIDIPELNRFLPDEEDMRSDTDDSGGDDETSEGFPDVPQPVEPQPLPVDPIRRPQTATRGAEGEDEGPTGDGDTGGGGDGDGGGGEGGVGEGGGRGGRGSPPLAIGYRAYPIGSTDDVYAVVVRSEDGSRGRVMLAVNVVGDDAREAIQVSTAQTTNGRRVRVNESGRLGPVTIPANGPLQLEITLAEPMKVAMEVTAHEA